MESGGEATLVIHIEKAVWKRIAKFNAGFSELLSRFAVRMNQMYDVFFEMFCWRRITRVPDEDTCIR